MNQVQINLDALDDLSCECGSIYLVPRVRLKKVSAILSPTGTDTMLMLNEGFLCPFCQKMFDMSGQEIKKEKTNGSYSTLENLEPV